MKKRLLISIGVLGLGACTWVKPQAGADGVALVKAQAIAECKKLGHTTSTTLNKVVGISRSEQKKTKELVTLAKNQAVSMGGDTIVAVGQPSGAEQEFAVYRCQ